MARQRSGHRNRSLIDVKDVKDGGEESRIGVRDLPESVRLTRRRLARAERFRRSTESPGDAQWGQSPGDIAWRLLERGWPRDCTCA